MSHNEPYEPNEQPNARTEAPLWRGQGGSPPGGRAKVVEDGRVQRRARDVLDRPVGEAHVERDAACEAIRWQSRSGNQVKLRCGLTPCEGGGPFAM